MLSSIIVEKMSDANFPAVSILCFDAMRVPVFLDPEELEVGDSFRRAIEEAMRSAEGKLLRDCGICTPGEEKQCHWMLPRFLLDLTKQCKTLKVKLDLLLVPKMCTSLGTTYKTLVTTRDRSTIPPNTSNVIYQLPLLSEDDSLALFCIWAFGQTSIPGCADANLVKEVQKEYKGLPLALKVIGNSLCGEPLVTWQSSKKKLTKGETISDYHREGLLRRLETSFDVVGDVLGECFLDLGAFPEDREICVHALLDLWVYVRQLEWNDAFVILLEPTSRNLLNLTSNAGNGGVISSGDVSDVHFSQHGVMRNVALYLGYQESPISRTRLIMPRKEHNLPGKWELFKNEEFSARIVSIHTGPMNKTQWSEMNFPDTEALFLIFMASHYSLPPFLKFMKKLKFLTILSDEGKLLREIVESALHKRKPVPLDVATFPVGLDEAVQDFESKVGSSTGSQNVHCI